MTNIVKATLIELGVSKIQSIMAALDWSAVLIPKNKQKS